MIVFPSTTEELSKFVFGSSHMLAIIAEIASAEEGRFSIPSLSQSTGLAPSSVHNQLERLKSAQLVKQDGRMPDGRTLMFKRAEVPFWHAVAQLDPQELSDSWSAVAPA